MQSWLWSLLLASSACFAGTWLLAWLLRGRSAAWRHLVWSVGFVMVLVCWALMAGSWKLELPWLPARVVVVERSYGAGGVTVFNEAMVKSGARSIPMGTIMVASHDLKNRSLVGNWWMAGWGLGVAVCLLPLAAGW